MNISIIGTLGIINMLLILFQILGGLRVIKVSYTVHKMGGLILLVTAAIHAALALLA